MNRRWTLIGLCKENENLYLCCTYYVEFAEDLAKNVPDTFDLAAKNVPDTFDFPPLIFQYYKGITFRKRFVQENPVMKISGDGSGQGNIMTLVPRVALPSGCVRARGFDSLPFCLRGLTET